MMLLTSLIFPKFFEVLVKAQQGELEFFTCLNWVSNGGVTDDEMMSFLRSQVL